MTAVDRVKKTQRSLSVVMGGGALLWAAAGFFALLIIAALLNATVPMSPIVRGILPLIAAVGSVAILAWLAWRGRFAWSFDRVALWIEERAPELRYALVTAIDPRYQTTAGPLFDPIVARVDTGRFVRKAATTNMLPALVALAITATAYAMIPSTLKPSFNPSALTGGPAVPAIVGNRLTPLSGSVTPPAYANLRSTALSEPSTISSLQGSHVMLTGLGTPDGISVALNDPNTNTSKPVSVTAGGKGWTVNFTMSDSIPLLLKLVDRQYHTNVIVNPIIDESPTARLTVPQRDTTLRDIPQTLHLSAELSDDIGLATVQYEYIIANLGSGDAAEARTGIIQARSYAGNKTATFDLTVPYASLKLIEGDILSVRATVVDNNTLTGPHKGYSETRVIRIARKSEYDSLNINAAPPSADTAIQTLRMLIIATETWNRKKPTLTKALFQDSAIKLGGKADLVKQKIDQIIDEQTGGGEVARNPLLDTASQAMFEATRSLYIAETGEALPQMKLALKMLQKYSSEKKYYLRGVMPPVVVNINRVRETGKDSGKALPRPEGRALEGVDKDRLRLQYVHAVDQLLSKPTAAIEEFQGMQVMTLRTYPGLASALNDAINAAKTGRDMTLPLLRARRVLDGSSGAIDSLPSWSGAWGGNQ